MRKLILPALLALGLVFANITGASASRALPLNSDNCTPTLNYCDEQLVATNNGNAVWIWGYTHNVQMTGRTDLATPSIWTPVGSSEPGWYYVLIQNSNLFWTAANSGGVTEIFPEGQSSGDTHQWWHLEESGTSHIIENYWVTTHYGVYCCEGGGANPGDLAFSNGGGDDELWNFRM